MNEIELNKIRNVLVVAECGKTTIPYGAIYIYADGPNNVKQITLSIGFTQYGNLPKVIEEYVRRNGRDASKLKPMLAVMRQLDTVNNHYYIQSLKDAGTDPIMQQVQDVMFNRLYLDPAVRWGETEGFTEPLSYLVICDSFLHSGSMLSSIRNKFPERTPANGGNEHAWTSAYTNARHEWLRTHSKTILNKTIYRTDYYKRLIADGDWGLERYHTFAMNGLKPMGVLT